MQSKIDLGSGEDKISLCGEWSGATSENGRLVRRIQKDAGIILTLPDVKGDIPEETYVLTITYFDEKPANISVQVRDNVTCTKFREIQDGDLLVSGAQVWRTWKVPVKFATTGEGMGENELKSTVCLLGLCADLYDDDKVKGWSEIARSYQNIAFPESEPQIVEAEPVVYPTQTTPIALQIQDGVLVQRLAGDNTIMNNGVWDGKSELGELNISPYLVAAQAEDIPITRLTQAKDLGATEPEYDGLPWATNENIKGLNKEDALKWLDANKIEIAPNTYIWESNTDNAYNDIVTKAPWASAFFQRHIIEAYLDNDRTDMAIAAMNAFDHSVEEGGLSSTDWQGTKWYEEVPNKTHILNAHMASVVALYEVWQETGNETARILFEQGIESLKEKVSSYDAGYWTVYDRNPQDEILFQLDWVSGENASLLIDDITLVNMRSNIATYLDVGEDNDFEGHPYISGGDWGAAETVDGNSVRPILNGYYLRDERAEGGTKQNTYFFLTLPERNFEEFFDVPIHKLIIRYKDDSKGIFRINERSKNRGDSLEFEPLRDGEIVCVGDGKWKTKEILLYPATLGWYLGYEYHSYHAEELARIAEIADSWYLKECAEKYQYYYDSWLSGQSSIIDEHVNAREIKAAVSVEKGIQAEAGYGLENSLDGDWLDDYTASSVQKLPQEFELSLSESTDMDYIVLVWESEHNYATDYEIEGMDEQGNVVWNTRETDCVGMEQIIKVDCEKNVQNIKFSIKKVKGVSGVLLRQIRFLRE